MIINKNKMCLPNSEFLWLKRSSGVGSLYCYSLFWQKTGEWFSRKLFQDSGLCSPWASLPVLSACHQLAFSKQKLAFSTNFHWPPGPLPTLRLFLLRLLLSSPGKEALSDPKQLQEAINSTLMSNNKALLRAPHPITHVGPSPCPPLPTWPHICLQYSPESCHTELSLNTEDVEIPVWMQLQDQHLPPYRITLGTDFGVALVCVFPCFQKIILIYWRGDMVTS